MFFWVFFYFNFEYYSCSSGSFWYFPDTTSSLSISFSFPWSSFSNCFLLLRYSSLMVNSFSLKNESFFLIEEFQWFLMVLSVLPGKWAEISAHQFPSNWWVIYSNHSSFSLHSLFFIWGFKWLCHLSRHYFPTLSFIMLAMWDHREGPFFFTKSISFLSSSGVQAFFLRMILERYKFLSKSGLFILRKTISLDIITIIVS